MFYKICASASWLTLLDFEQLSFTTTVISRVALTKRWVGGLWGLGSQKWVINAVRLFGVAMSPRRCCKSRHVVVSCKAKKQHVHARSGLHNHYSELFTWMAGLSFKML